MPRKREAPQEDVFEGMEALTGTAVIRDREPGSGSRARKTDAKAGKLAWKKLPVAKTKAPPKCDVCVGAMVEGGKWAAPDPAVYERSVGGEKVLLCWEHASEQRTADGLTKFKRPSGL